MDKVIDNMKPSHIHATKVIVYGIGGEKEGTVHSHIPLRAERGRIGIKPGYIRQPREREVFYD